MSFKDEYKKSYDDIVPDKEFIKQLSEKMNEERHKRQKISYRVLTALVGIVILLLVGLSAFYFTKGFPKQSKPVQVQTGNSLPIASSEIGIFASEKWYDPKDKPEKILSDFLERLGDREQLVIMYQSTENTFTKEQSVSEADIDHILEKLQTAMVLLEGQKKQSGGDYYMAEFQNGDIIKFVITDDGYFWFLDLEYVYQYQWQE